MGLRIGIDATCWANGRGYGRFTRELVSALIGLAPQHEFTCFLDELSAGRFDLSYSNLQRRVVHQGVAPTLAAVQGGSRSPVDMLRLTRAVWREKLDVFFAPSVYGYFPLPPRLPTSLTVYDAIPERFPELTLPTARDRISWAIKTKVALAQADVILTISEYSAKEVAKYLGVDRARMRITLPAVAEQYRPSESAEEIRAAAERAGVPAGARWLIYVGGFGAHKNVDVLAKAHARVARRHPEQPLVLLLTGSTADGFHTDVANIKATINQLGTEHLVVWTGYLPDAELRHLHSGAVALAIVSASEGFGLPAVEAARCGAPVIATTESPLPEVLEGGGFFVAPGNVDAVERALEILLTDEATRQAMGAKALERAMALSWRRSAAVALEALEGIAPARRT